MLKPFVLFAGTILFLALVGGQAVALEKGPDKASVLEAMIELLEDKGVLSEQEAMEMKGRLSREEAREEEKTLRIVQVEAAKAARDEMEGGLPLWTRRIRLVGDFRVGYHRDHFPDENAENLVDPSNPGYVLQTASDRDRLRYRARIGLRGALNDWSVFAFRLSTGNDEAPVSTSDTLGDYANKDDMALDLAYLRLMPARGLTIWAGRHPNPFFSTELVWDRDLNFEGLSVNYTRQWLDNFGSFATVGAFPLQQVDEVYGSEKDKWLYGIQGGVQYEPVKGISAKLGLAYYYFNNIKGTPYETNDSYGAKDWSAPSYVQLGNSFYDDTEHSDIYFLASDYHEINVTGSIDIGFWHPVHVVFIGDYVRNLAFDEEGLEDRFNTDIQAAVDGYLVGLAVGYPSIREQWDWRWHLFYKYLGADAVVDAFTDSDFHLGGTNAKGWILGYELGLVRNFWLSAKWLSSNEVDGPQLSVDTLQVYLNTRF